MNNFFDEEENDGTTFRDIIMLALFGFVAFVFLMLAHLNTPTKAKTTAITPGNIIVEVRWPDELDVDVDLWVRAPDDRPVGYSNKSGAIFDLLRDDLGVRNDYLGINYETAFSRGAPPGEYVINLHLYRNNIRIYPVSCNVVVSRRNEDGSVNALFRGTIDLLRLGEEITVVRFELNEDGVLVPGSLSPSTPDVLTSLRSTRTQQ